jgi:hypothetical protein
MAPPIALHPYRSDHFGDFHSTQLACIDYVHSTTLSEGLKVEVTIDGNIGKWDRFPLIHKPSFTSRTLNSYTRYTLQYVSSVMSGNVRSVLQTQRF